MILSYSLFKRAASRLSIVSDGANSATYSYLANSPLAGQINFTSNTTTAVTTTKTYDNLNRLIAITSIPAAGGSWHPSHQYQYNAANQRTRATLYDSSCWLYGYDALGQVTSGNKYWPNGTLVPGEQFGDTFDDIGNRTAATQGGDSHGGSLRSATYTANDLNQYTSRTVANSFDVLGQANTASSVLVNGSPVGYRNGEFYQTLFNATNSSAPVWVAITNTATNGSGYSNVTGHFFIPQTPETFLYDLDGNLTNDGRFSYTWDAENRLIAVSNIASIPTSGQYFLSFTYDYLGRRVQKIVSTNSGTGYVPSYTNKFIYDGWNVIAVLDGGNNLIRSFVWGSDLSGSMQGAGGVGGLISMTISSGQPNAGTYFYCYDGNGNVIALVNATSGAIAAQYEYGPFGELLRATGPLAFTNSFRFSTKYQDDESGLLYYGYRYYNASTGRWLSRDPIGEDGGVNLCDFVANDPINKSDPLGLCNINIRCGPVKRFGVTLGWHCGVIAPNGVEYGIGSVTGPSQGSSGGGTAYPYPDPVKNPNPKPGEKQPDQVDYPVSCGKCKSCDSVQKCIEDYNRNTPVPPYNAFFGPNSDTWAHNMLTHCGCSVDPITRPCYTVFRSPRDGGTITICPSTTIPPGTVAW